MSQTTSSGDDVTRPVSDLVTKATGRTPPQDRCEWADFGLAKSASMVDMPCPNEADLTISARGRSMSGFRFCGEHFMSAAELYLKEWRRWSSVG